MTTRHAPAHVQQSLHAAPRFAALWIWLWMALASCLAPPLGYAQTSIPKIATSSKPLHLSSNTEHPTMVLALSVEYPTTGALYLTTNNNENDNLDSSYSNQTRYLGYFDAEGCYSYVTLAATASPPTGVNREEMKYFDRQGPASPERTCSNAFSGNFLNWATSSSIDMLRLALSGGDRLVDTENYTILQRAYLPSCWMASYLQPQKILKNTTINGLPYWGAIPQKLVSVANNQSLYFNNEQNKFFVGTSEIAHSCYSTSLNNRHRLSQTSGLSPDIFFYARARVCKFENGALQESRHWSLCTKYPNGNYKPTGSIQKYSHQLRLSAFGYLDDDDINRYGGVMRAPMKYVGPRTFDIQGNDNTPPTGNPNREWDAHTGIFIKNPDASANPPRSGVINYLNQFGRQGAMGYYKTYDTVSELYYQALRYLQGLPPTPEAIQNSHAVQGGFPVYTEWEDPFGGERTDQSNYACHRNNIALIGDIFTNDVGWRHLPPPSPTENIPDFKAYFELVRSFELGQTKSYTDNAGNSHTTKNPNPRNPWFPSNEGLSPEGISRTNLMGYTYWARSHDIRGKNWTGNSSKQNALTSKRRPGLRVKTFIFDVNENNFSIDLYTRQYYNQFFLAAKYGGYETSPSALDSSTYNPYGNPFYRADGTADNNIWKKRNAVDALTYFLQSNPDSVLKAFDEIFNRAALQAHSLGGNARSSNMLSTRTTTHQYIPYFDTGNWSGDLQKQSIQVTDDQAQNGSMIWSAAQKLRNKPEASRNIFTGNGTQAGAAFVWTDISEKLKAQLSQLYPSTPADSYAQQRLLFLRGSRQGEGSPFRVRDEILGDILNSNVIYHAQPSSAFGDAGYTAFRHKVANRPATLYVGANDGMLHAFNDADGEELFAFIPSWLGPKLAALTDNDYSASHQSYVDGAITVKEAQVALNGNADDWKTVLVGSTGTGGAGVFALDVSQPEQFAARHVLWEFTKDVDADLGQVLGAPQILKFKTSGDASPAVYRWFAVFGSGLNNYVAETQGGPYSPSGDPAIFMLALDKPVGQAWQAGVNYFKITIPADPLLKSTHAPGLLNFSVLYGGAGEVTDMYAGDLHGNLWKLRWGNLTPSHWTLSHLSAFNRGTAATPAPYPLYTARDADKKPQPITAAPKLFTGPVISALETFYVAFGTGKYVESKDTLSNHKDSFYVIFDNGSTSQDSGTDLTASGYRAAILGRQRLAPASVSNDSLSIPSFRWGRSNSNTDTSIRSGWYLDFPSGGERLVFPIQELNHHYLAFNTLQPNQQAVELSICAPFQALGRSYLVDITQGQGKLSAIEADRLGGPLFFTHTDLTTTSPTDSTGRRIRTTTHLEPNTSTSDGLRIQIPEVIGRLNWREVHNYQDLRPQ